MQQQLADIQSQLSEAQKQLQQTVSSVSHSTQTGAEQSVLTQALLVATQSTQTEGGNGIWELTMQKKLLKAEVESMKRQVVELGGALRDMQKEQQQVGGFLAYTLLFLLLLLLLAQICLLCRLKSCQSGCAVKPNTRANFLKYAFWLRMFLLYALLKVVTLNSQTQARSCEQSNQLSCLLKAVAQSEVPSSLYSAVRTHLCYTSVWANGLVTPKRCLSTVLVMFLHRFVGSPQECSYDLQEQRLLLCSAAVVECSG